MDITQEERSRKLAEEHQKEELRRMTIPKNFYMDLTYIKPLKRKGLDNPWNIIKIGHGKSEKLHDIVYTKYENLLKVFYPKNSYKPSSSPEGGIGFYASPTELFPCNEITLSYDLYFDDSFDPNLGGKLPGLFMGPPGSSGGRHSDKNGSCRVMWRKYSDSSKNIIDAEAYIYASKKQKSEYNKIPGLVINKKYGDSLWRGNIQLNKYKWNNIQIYCKVNTFDKSDGILKLTINGDSYEYSNMIWTNKKSKIQGITFDTFFGGGTSKWATPHDTSIYFRDVLLR